MHFHDLLNAVYMRQMRQILLHLFHDKCRKIKIISEELIFNSNAQRNSSLLTQRRKEQRY